MINLGTLFSTYIDSLAEGKADLCSTLLKLVNPERENSLKAMLIREITKGLSDKNYENISKFLQSPLLNPYSKKLILAKFISEINDDKLLEFVITQENKKPTDEVRKILLDLITHAGKKFDVVKLPLSNGRSFFRARMCLPQLEITLP